MPLRYPGQYFDAEARVAYNYFRDYEQGTGRYTQADPIGLGGGWNRFVYGDSRPMSRIDPLGLDDYPIFPQAYLDRQLVSADYRSRPSAYRDASPSPPTPCEVKCFLPNLQDVAAAGGVKAAEAVGGEIFKYAASRAVFVYGVYATSDCIDDCKREGTCPKE